MKNLELHRVPVERLRRTCKPEELDFCMTTEDVPPLDGFIGQERAVRAMQFGLAMDAPCYNIFVVGRPGTGKSTYVQAVVAQTASKRSQPSDWCYIYNFAEPDRPLAVALPAGEGRGFQKSMEEFVSDLRVALPKAFEGGDYEQQKDAIVQSVSQKMAGYFQQLEEEAGEAGFNVKQTSKGVVFIPLKDGEPLSQEDYEKLPPQQRWDMEEKGRKLRKKLEGAFHTGRMLEKQAKEQIDELEKQIALFAAGPLLGKLQEKYKEFPAVLNYLEIVLKDLTGKLDLFKSSESHPAQQLLQISQEEVDPFNRYKVNLFVNNGLNGGAPVVIEPSSSYYNLFGKIEYRSQVLSMNTDFMMVKPGAIHRANGGYLILQAKDVLADPFIWDTLKKALKYRQAMVENIGEQYRLVPTATLRPEPIPLNVKVIMIGNPVLYHLLYSLDEDFQKLFKVKVDFDTEMLRSPENLRHYASFVSSVCRRENLKHFSRDGLARLIEHCSRLAGAQDKLSTRFNEVVEVVSEAAAWAKVENSRYVESSHVNKAIKEKIYRSNRIEEKLQEMVLQETIMINTDGAVVGQVNGLSISSSGDYTFGRPIRITARTYMGRGGVINIERETNLSGNIHNKGVLTLGGYLGGKFAQGKPLGVTAQITFEQLYDGVEGDSASSAELYAILSSLAGLPLKQGLAVTGSVNQFGEIQPIGGATEKIEGFFDLCRAKGLSGDQGVVIPVQNLSNLMLKEDVVEAVKNDLFHIYAVRNIEEGIELLSGVPAGQPGEDGNYPDGTVFRLVDQKIHAYNEGLRKAGANTRRKKTAGQVK
ncbi:Lon protease [Pelotomaculum sp. FP]|uniref:ATP-binding protein n=1 Tax=Pelotomaculum sp. FP TaxID=261474 RepID=UPI0010655C9B|nr:ATP-binding protein [Pelotomaculum sp. FP]TEB18027.1 Lon protease [Pelotomaculum sp. FP]